MHLERTVVVVPCYDEAARLDRTEFLRLVASSPAVSLLFVDDGSRDGTGNVLRALRAASGGRIEVLALDRNGGKAEAVRAGMLAALEAGATTIGYVDADLATPVDEILRMIASMREAPVAVLLGARVRLLGTRIERKASRHFLGRVFATLASLTLRLPVYDTQCGAKLFQATPVLARALERPFRSRWIFDVELLARLRHGNAAGAIGPEAMRELPLQAWRDVRGSKLRGLAMLRAGLELLALMGRTLLARAGRGSRARRKDPTAPRPGLGPLDPG